MSRSLHEQPELSEKFIASLLTRNLDLEEDLCDQLFNHSEKRLARALLKPARLREQGFVPDANIPELSHEILAEMVGTNPVSYYALHEQIRRHHRIDYSSSAGAELNWPRESEYSDSSNWQMVWRKMAQERKQSDQRGCFPGPASRSGKLFR